MMLNESAAARRGHPVMEHELAHVRLGHSWDMLTGYRYMMYGRLNIVQLFEQRSPFAVSGLQCCYQLRGHLLGAEPDHPADIRACRLIMLSPQIVFQKYEDAIAVHGGQLFGVPVFQVFLCLFHVAEAVMLPEQSEEVVPSLFPDVDVCNVAVSFAGVAVGAERR